MKRSFWILVAIGVLTLAGCVSPRLGSDGYEPLLVRRPDPVRPNLFVDANKFVVVDQEPIRIGPDHVNDGRVTISWALPARMPFVFAPKGIEIGPALPQSRVAPVDLKCGPVGMRIFECSYKKPEAKTTVFKYTVRIQVDKTDLPPLDPYIVNEF